MSKSKQQWAFFVDESGDFDEASEPVSVAGLLVNESMPFYRPTEIRKALEAAVPGFPWPLHAAFLNQPAYVAIAAYQYEPQVLDRHRPGFGSIVRQAVSTCEGLGAADLDSVTGAIKAGRKPPFDALRRLSDLIRQYTPETCRHLVDASREAWRAVHVVSERLMVARDEQGNALAAFIAASETRCGDAAASATARYFTVLRSAVERAAAIVERHPGQHQLLLHVQQRHVYDDRFKKLVMLTPQHLGSIIREAAAVHRRVHVLAAETPDFGTRVSVEYVLADFLANRSRGVLDDAQSALPNVEERVGEYFGAPLRSGAPNRSHLAATGLAWAELWRSSSDGVVSAEWSAPYRRWAREQASQWTAGVA